MQLMCPLEHFQKVPLGAAARSLVALGSGITGPLPQNLCVRRLWNAATHTPVQRHLQAMTHLKVPLLTAQLLVVVANKLAVLAASFGGDAYADSAG